ncbi:MAG: hypothetical protein EOO41_04725, partial [Methanobacteriota archaeon]
MHPPAMGAFSQAAPSGAAGTGMGTGLTPGGASSTTPSSGTPATGVAGAAQLPSTASSAAAASRIYIGSLHYDIREEHLRELFSPFGNITRVDMSHEPATGKTKGFAFLSYDNT